MTDLSPTAQAVFNAVLIHWEEYPVKEQQWRIACVLRAAADHLTDATSSHTLYAIADELEGITYGTYRCNLEAQ